MLMKEYRICMPLTVEEYHIGQLYMIAKHCNEQSEKGEGVEVVSNKAIEDSVHGKGQYTEKRVYLSSRLPSWIRTLIPNIFYVTEKAWNYYPFTITEYTCSFIPKFSIYIETRYQDNCGCTENCLDVNEEDLPTREVVHLDIVYDDIPEKHYKEEEDLTKFQSKKTKRGPLEEGWKDTIKPVMCSYKLVKVKCEVWGVQGRLESFTHRAVRDILLLGHRQAFAWVDEWYNMKIEDIREYEKRTFDATNKKVGVHIPVTEPLLEDKGTTPPNTPTEEKI